MTRILIVYDDPILASALKLRLESGNLGVAIARDCEEARRIIAKVRPEIVLLDYFLQDGQGPTLLHQLGRESDGNRIQSVIFLNPLARISKNAEAAGATFVIDENAAQPITMMEDLASVLQLLPTESDLLVEHTRDNQSQLLQQVLKESPQRIAMIRSAIRTLVRGKRDLRSIGALVQAVHRLSASLAFAGHHGSYRVASTMEALLLTVHDNPNLITKSSLRTLSQTADLLYSLIAPENIGPAMEAGEAKVVCVNHDPAVRAAIADTLSTLRFKHTTAGTATQALSQLDQERADLIFLNTGLPDHSGFVLCAQIRGLIFHEKTPIVFLGGHDDVQIRAQAKLSGADDFMPKPFSPWELALKTLYWTINPKLHVKGTDFSILA